MLHTKPICLFVGLLSLAPLGCHSPRPPATPPPPPSGYTSSTSRTPSPPRIRQPAHTRPTTRTKALCKDGTKKLCGYRAACEKGDMDGCFALATAYAGGLQKAARDDEQARKLYVKACQKKHGPSCTGLSIFYRNGWGVPRDLLHARQLLVQACNHKHGMGCKRLADMQRHGVGGPKQQDKALQAYIKACFIKHTDACYNAGLMLQLGIGTKKIDIPRALTLYVRACKKRYGLACYNIASLLFEGKGIAKDLKKARGYLKLACDTNIGKGCSKLGQFALNGIGGKQHLKDAIKYLDMGCKLGEGTACNVLAIYLSKQKGLTKRHHGTIRTYFTRGCRAEHKRACFNLALMYARGTGTKRDPELAAKVLDKACQLGHPQACFQWASFMQSKLQAARRNNKTNPTSKPTPQNNKTKPATPKQITARLQRACLLGESAGCYLLGWRYLQTRKAYKQARKWMKKGCKLAHPIACNEWGSMLLNGRGGTPDVAKAQKAFTKGCKAKYGSSCYNLGLIYMLGKGTPKQPRLARSFFQKACTLRQPVACANLAFLMTRGLGGPKGTATQIKALMNKACQMGFRLACQKGKAPRTTSPSKRR